MFYHYVCLCVVCVEICLWQCYSIPVVVRGQLFFHLYVSSKVKHLQCSKSWKIFSRKYKEESQNERTVFRYGELSPKWLPPKAMVSF